MGMETIEFIYFVCFFLGLGFAIVSALLSGVFSGAGHGHMDFGGGHADLGGGHGTMGNGGAHDGSTHFSPFSPVVLAMFIASFGGTGIILHKALHWPLQAHLPVAAFSGFIIAGAVFYVFYRIFEFTQASSGARPEELIGLEAEVTVPLPHEGLGEIVYSVGGLRYTSPARTQDGKELPAGARVTIVQQVGNMYIVQKAQEHGREER